jgi:hypothetical protein
MRGPVATSPGREDGRKRARRAFRTRSWGPPTRPAEVTTFPVRVDRAHSWTPPRTSCDEVSRTAAFGAKASVRATPEQTSGMDENQASRRALARLLLSHGEAVVCRAGRQGYRFSSIALAGPAGVDALAYRREHQQARPRLLRHSSAAVHLRLARCLRVRTLAFRTLRFGPYSAPRARRPSTSMREVSVRSCPPRCAGFPVVRVQVEW